MEKIFLPHPTATDGEESLQMYANYLRADYPAAEAARMCLRYYRNKLQAFLDKRRGAATVESASPTNLPEWAKATPDDLLLMSGKSWSNEADPLNWHAARVLARQPALAISGDAVEGAAKVIYERAMLFDRSGAPSWQERGNSDAQDRAREVARDIFLSGAAPALTDEPPEVTDGDVESACSMAKAGTWAEVVRGIIAADRARVWQTHRPKPVDAVRFALGKVSDESLVIAVLRANGAFERTRDPVEARAQHINVLRTELARILPVAETKQWAELTDDNVEEIVNLSIEAYSAGFDLADSRALQAKAFRASLSAYAPPPRKVEVTPDVVNVYLHARGLDKSAYDSMELAIEQANTQAEALDYADRMQGALFQEAHTAAHAAKLEAMLTVPGVDGPVKLWLPFEALVGIDCWVQVHFEKGFIRYPGDKGGLNPWVTKLRQTPAPKLRSKAK